MFSSITKGKVYFIAEIGSNFDGSLSKAKELISLASWSGANAAKFQHYTAGTLISAQGFADLENNSHQAQWKKSVFDTYDKASLDVSWTRELYECCKENNIDFLTSAYSNELLEKTVDFIPFIKIGSGDISDVEFLQYASTFGKPIALGTGASSIQDVTRAVQALGTNTPICLMQCNTNYENNCDHARYQNISVLSTYKRNWPHLNLGLSCHMKTDLSVVLAVALGAQIIEKHFTDDNLKDGPDHKFALLPNEFKAMVAKVRLAECMLGNAEKRIEDNEVQSHSAQRRGIVASKDLDVGHILTRDDLMYLRPYTSTSLHPYEANKVIGHKLLESLKMYQPIFKSNLKSDISS